MYCQQCGAQIRSRARFCNQCGTQVRQRFVTPIEPRREASKDGPRSDQQPLLRHAWPHAEEAIVMPAVPKTVKPSSPRPPERSETTTRVDLPPPPSIEPAKPAPLAPRQAPKAFFTQIGTALPNRQHSRLVLVVPIVLLIAMIVFIFAYIAAR
jgi:hypothetical protein